METKMPFYNSLNMFLIGLVFLGGCYVISPRTILELARSWKIESLGSGLSIMVNICLLALTYEIGLCINRFGSICLEPILRSASLVKFNSDYILFNEKKKEFPIMGTLSREYSFSRTNIVLFLCFSIICIINGKCCGSAFCLAMAIIFFLSCRKHAERIVELMGGEDARHEDGCLYTGKAE